MFHSKTSWSRLQGNTYEASEEEQEDPYSSRETELPDLVSMQQEHGRDNVEKENPKRDAAIGICFYGVVPHNLVDFHIRENGSDGEKRPKIRKPIAHFTNSTKNLLEIKLQELHLF